MTTIVRRPEATVGEPQRSHGRRRYILLAALLAANGALLAFLTLDGSDDSMTDPERITVPIAAAGPASEPADQTALADPATPAPPLRLTIEGSVASGGDAENLVRLATGLFRGVELDVQLPVAESPRPPKHALLRVPAEAIFEPGTTNFADDAERLLASIAELSNRVEALPLHVIAHSDRPRTLAGSLTLTEQQAQELVSRLSDLGVAPQRMAAFGRGNQEPFIDVSRTTRLPERIEVLFVRAFEQPASS